MIRKFKSIFCRHKFYVYLEKVVIQSDNENAAFCDRCGAEFYVNVFAMVGHDEASYDQLCKKRSYTSKKKAETVLNHVRKQKRKKLAKRIYRCTKCKAWHLTSKNSYGMQRTR